MLALRLNDETTATRLAAALTCLLLGACASLLPTEESASRTPWGSFDEARATYERIMPMETTVSELRELGFDPYQDANIAILNYADLLRRLVGNSGVPFALLDAPLRDCLEEGEHCTAYEIDVKHIERKREGSFWLDFLTFRRTTNVSGWRSNALVVLKDDLVVYKLWGGQPTIKETEKDTRPLGPLQGLGESLRPK
jgi:hypothetical protein